MKKALVLSLICALGLGFAAFSQTLSGSWETVITLDLTPGAVWPDDVDIASEIIITYTVGDWSFSSETDILNGVWNNQDFDFAGVLGAFTISGDIEFDPVAAEFVSLEVNASVSIAGVSFGAYFDLVPGGTDLILTASGVAGDVSIAVELKLGDEEECDFDFNYVKVNVGFPFCCADVSAEILFYCEGFSYVKFCVDDLTIENLPWLTLGACIQFQTDSKVFTWYPAIDLGVIGCDFDLYYRLLPDTVVSNNVLVIDGIQFDGIQIACEIGGVAFTGITYFGPLDHGPWWAPGPPGILYGLYRDFLAWGYEWDIFEAYQIATTDDGCCGPFAFDVTVYFEDDGAMFDVAWIQANLEIQIATQFTFGLGLNTDVTFGNVNDLVFTFLVEW